MLKSYTFASSRIEIRSFDFNCTQKRMSLSCIPKTARKKIISKKITKYSFFFDLECSILNMYALKQQQGRSQPHSPGWARLPLSSFFHQMSINFSHFSSNFSLSFLISALRVGD